MRTPHKNARKLRQEMPPAEALLWTSIRRRQLGGFHFRRQHTIGPYIVDFACAPIKLVIELDGNQHGEPGARARDSERDAFLASEGWHVLRFWNHEVFENLDGVLDKILVTAEDLSREVKS